MRVIIDAMKTLLLASLCVTSSWAAEYRVADPAAFSQVMEKLMPGDGLIMEAGNWKDADLLFQAKGTMEKPITLKATQSGAVELTGSSKLRIAGEHLVIEGLWFHNALPAKDDIITFRADAKTTASHCRLVNCAITQDIESKDSQERKWVSLYGENNVIERCHFEGKTSKGTLLVAWLSGDGAQHRIEKCYFGSRPKLGKNGGEIIRLGDSASSMMSARCVVEGNYFEHCDGEMECISNKSCDNVYRGNVFVECQGTLTLRHGNRCLVEGNFFHGNHRKETGGIRLIGEEHQVRNNYLEGLEDNEARTAICLMNGIVNSPANGYFQVKKALIEGNAIMDCPHAILIGFADKDVKAPLAPEGVQFRKNTVFSKSASEVKTLDPNAKIEWTDNLMLEKSTYVSAQDFAKSTGFQEPQRSEVGVGWKVEK